MKKENIKVSVIITAHNYGRFLKQCIDSVLQQNFESYEVIVVNDGSTDETPMILADYAATHPSKVKVLELDGVGLAKACNAGILNSSGEYIIRLDADDYFDENILLVESNILDKDPNIHMVYTDYYQVSVSGEIIDQYRLLKSNEEVKLLDRSPLAAGAMYRRYCFDEIGGYREELRYQEDYDFWIRFTDKFNVYNVNLPLMYYRRHDHSMSRNFEARMDARRYVKHKFVESKQLWKGKKVIAVIPAMKNFRNQGNLALRNLSNQPLIAYTLQEALKCQFFDRVIVSTEDEEIAKVSEELGAEIPFLRPKELANSHVPFDAVLRDLLKRFEKDENYSPDFIVVLPYNTPFRLAKHIEEGIDTILMYQADSVLGVMTDLTFHWKPGEYGLAPVGYQKRLLREDKDTIYKECGALYVVKRENLDGGYLGKTIGHIELSPKEGWRIEDDFTFDIAQKILEESLILEKHS